MTFRIIPDPRHPLGGHALLTMDEGQSTGNGQLTIRRSYDLRYLGASGWQLAKATLGPLESAANGLILGPDVVRHVDEFDNLEITFEGGSAGSVVWPGSVLLAPDAARDGGFARSVTEHAPDVPVVAAGQTETEGEGEPPPADSPHASRRGACVVLALVVVVLGIAAALYVLRDDIVEPQTAKTGLPCSDDAVTGVAETDLLLEWVERCGTDEGVAPQTRLSVVERLIGKTPDALVVMGGWYDPALESDSSPFERPALEIAARYYADAADAGVDGAQGLLDDVCGRLDADNFMQNDAIDLYCGGGQ